MKSWIKYAVGVSLAAMMAAPAAAADLTIGFAVPSMADSFWTSATYGVEKEAKAEGVTLIKLDAGANTNVTQQTAQIGDLIQRGVNAIIIGATNGDAIKPITERAIAAGIPVIGFSSPPSTDKLASYIGADHYDMGKLQAECLGKAMGGKGKVAMMSFIEGQIWADLRAKGFKETMAKNYPEIEIVAENRRAVGRADGITAAEDLIQRFPDIGGFYTTVDELGAGAVTAIKAAGKADSIKVSTSNLSEVAQQMIESGDLACTSIQKIVEQGENALKEAVKAAEKKPTEPAVILSALLVTKDNLHTIDLGPVSAPADYRP
ncbi:D-ribose-binding periplasmic protein precursor [Hartmannibacter diazotrophicus]|uniref:D-ribose-binding periplasmic protein n=1 Tax=Hartmannibacter diazotrophicus TaxID=1482074 RepID=A0A2C9D681_9HYPH|nr:TMAO reductase system protein TorT [Hartmannibacter diazotrophicus]SON55700.1 D-ribose-binding periplasmic protein precursor [Hartmannibacter diazotrophicus]